MKLRQIREAQKRKNKNNISQMRERLCRLTYLYADGPVLARRIDGRHVPDLRMLADTFRKWCGEKSISLDTASIEKTFTTWCKSYSAR